MRAALFLLLAACTGGTWSDGTAIAVVVETNIAEPSSRAFVERMRADLDVWNVGLVELGCVAPFRFVELESDADARIVLRGKDRWQTYGGVGAFYPEVIYILAEGDGTLDTYVGDPRWITALHELGHALGLEHNSHHDSVMSSAAVRPSTSDMFDAAAAVGCTTKKGI